MLAGDRSGYGPRALPIGFFFFSGLYALLINLDYDSFTFARGTNSGLVGIVLCYNGCELRKSLPDQRRLGHLICVSIAFRNTGAMLS